MAGLIPFKIVPKTMYEWGKWFAAQDCGTSTTNITTSAASGTTSSSKFWSFGSPSGTTGVFYRFRFDTEISAASLTTQRNRERARRHE